jgi:hypothetical protein
LIEKKVLSFFRKWGIIWAESNEKNEKRGEENGSWRVINWCLSSQNSLHCEIIDSAGISRYSDER